MQLHGTVWWFFGVIQGLYVPFAGTPQERYLQVAPGTKQFGYGRWIHELGSIFKYFNVVAGRILWSGTYMGLVWQMDQLQFRFGDKYRCEIELVG